MSRVLISILLLGIIVSSSSTSFAYFSKTQKCFQSTAQDKELDIGSISETKPDKISFACPSSSIAVNWGTVANQSMWSSQGSSSSSFPTNIMVGKPFMIQVSVLVKKDYMFQFSSQVFSTALLAICTRGVLECKPWQWSIYNLDAATSASSTSKVLSSSNFQVVGENDEEKHFLFTYQITENSVTTPGLTSFTSLVQVGSQYVFVTSTQEVLPDIPRKKVTKASCDFKPTETTGTSPLNGRVMITELGGSVSLKGTINGLLPNIPYYWHVHELGDIRSKSSQGSHFLGEAVYRGENNIELANIGGGGELAINIPHAVNVAVDLADSFLTLNNANSIIGRSLVIHGPGYSGPRLAHCVIAIEEEEDSYQSQPMPPSLVCDLSNQAISGHLIIEPYDRFLDADHLVNNGTNPPSTFTSLRVGTILSGLTQNMEYSFQIENKKFDLFEKFSTALNENSIFKVISTNTIQALHSLAGRKLVLLNKAQEIVSECIFGKTNPDLTSQIYPVPFIPAPQYGTPIGVLGPQVAAASCDFLSTPKFRNKNLKGYIHIQSISSMSSLVYYAITGLPQGSYTVRVNQYGDLDSPDGSSLGEAYIGNRLNDCEGCEPFLGNDPSLGNLTINAQSNRVALGSILARVFVSARYSIIGRGIAILDAAQNAIGQCTVGIAQNGVLPAPRRLSESHELLDAASCFIRGSGNQLDELIGGLIRFEREQTGSIIDSNLFVFKTRVSYFFAGLRPGSYRWRIRDWGDIEGGQGSHGSVFYGQTLNRTCANNSIPECEAVGMLGGIDLLEVGITGSAGGYFVDPYLNFRGRNGILGKSITLVDPVSDSLVAQCVIARSRTRILIDTPTLMPTLPDGQISPPPTSITSPSTKKEDRFGIGIFVGMLLCVGSVILALFIVILMKQHHQISGNNSERRRFAFFGSKDPPQEGLELSDVNEAMRAAGIIGASEGEGNTTPPPLPLKVKNTIANNDVTEESKISDAKKSPLLNRADSDVKNEVDVESQHEIFSGEIPPNKPPKSNRVDMRRGSLEGRLQMI